MQRSIFLCLTSLILWTGNAMPAAERIALDVLEPTERKQVVRDFPVAVGMVFPDGELRSVPGGRLVDDQGRAVPFEAEATGWWSPKRDSVKWLLLRFHVDTDRRYFFEPGASGRAPVGDPLAKETGAAIVVDTGPLRVSIDKAKPGLLDTATLNGKPMLRSVADPLVIAADDGKTRAPGALSGWKSRLAENTPARAVVASTGLFAFPDGKPMARLDVRYAFFKGQSSVRICHTFTWMVRDPQVGIRDLSVRLRPQLADGGRVLVGLSDFTDDAWSSDRNPAVRVLAWQKSGDEFNIELAGKVVEQGNRLGGWVAVEDADGRGVGVSLRHAWQTYPTAFGAADGEIQVQFWPTRGPRLSFLPEAIMPPDFFNAPLWKHFWWSRGEGHHVNEYRYRRTRDGRKIPSKYFEYTAEGMAKTHEMVVHLYDRRTPRGMGEVNSLAQHRVALRQDPAAAMRVPFMGFRIMPADPSRYPDFERAVDRLGAMSMARWVSQHNYGFMRFGMVLWGWPIHPNNSIYRWMDNLQYDQQLIPWLLWMRGGDRRFFEDAQIVSNHAMDVSTNHYTTRGYPPGNCATAGGGMPLPFVATSLWNMKGQKIHYLAHDYHLTGYHRAKEVMDEIIRGTTEFVYGCSDKPEGRHSTAREIYNMNVFWVNAYHETWDPAIGKLCRESNDITAAREYDADLNTFRQPQVYLFNGLVLQHRQWEDDKLAKVMLNVLKGNQLSVFSEGGVKSPGDTIGCQWAYDMTKDTRYALAAWDLARALADLTPDADYLPDKPWDGCISGSGLSRHWLMPILVAASLGDELGLDLDAPRASDDTFFYLEPESRRDKTYEMLAYARPHRTGDLRLRVQLKCAPDQPVEVIVTREGKGVMRKTFTVAKARRKGRFYSPQRHWLDAQMTIPDAVKGSVYKLACRSSARRATIRFDGQADLVYRFPHDGYHGTQPLAGGQRYTGAVVYTKTTQDEIVFSTNSNIFHRPYTIRDAKTGELLHRYNLADPLTMKHRVGKGRMIRILLSGDRAYMGWKAEGVSPWLAASAEEWFDPGE